MFCLGKRYPLENEKGCGDLMPKVIYKNGTFGCKSLIRGLSGENVKIVVYNQG